MDYAGWVTITTDLLEYPVSDASAQAPTGIAGYDDAIPSAIDYTENRLQRDLDFLASIVTSTGTFQANTRSQALPSVNILDAGLSSLLLGKPVAPGSIITTTLNSQNVNLQWTGHDLAAGDQLAFLQPLTVGGIAFGGVYNAVTIVDTNNIGLVANYPATATASGTVIGNGLYIVATQVSVVVGGVTQPPLEPTTRDFLEFAWPDDASPGANIPPVQWCPVDQSTILVGPSPDQAYPFKAVGTMRFPQLSYINTQNFLTLNVPDLYVAASMVFFAELQRDADFVASWEKKYQGLLGSAAVEETRKRYANLSPSPSNPAAAPAR